MDFEFSDRFLEALYKKYDSTFHITPLEDYIGVYWLTRDAMIDHSRDVERVLRTAGYQGKIEDVYLRQHLRQHLQPIE